MTKYVSCMILPSVPYIGCHHETLCRLTLQDHFYTHARSCSLSGGRVDKRWTMSCYQRAKSYLQQLERVQQAPKQKDPTLVNRKDSLILHGNVRFQVARVARDTIQQLSCETVCHPPYYTDLSPTPFSFLGNYEGNPLQMTQTCRLLFAQEFYRQDIAHWQKFVDIDGGLLWGLTMSKVLYSFFFLKKKLINQKQ